jgi:hypothetical protein
VNGSKLRSSVKNDKTLVENISAGSRDVWYGNGSAIHANHSERSGSKPNVDRKSKQVAIKDPECKMPEDPSMPRLFCFLVMRAHTEELELVQHQLRRGLGIFDCDSYAVFSDEIMQLTATRSLSPMVVNTTIIPGVPLDAAPAGSVSHIVNTFIFSSAWRLIAHEPCYAESDWFVKVDPDTVFIPSRLRPRLPKGWETDKPHGVYLRNCAVASPTELGFYGAMEVISGVGVAALLRRLDDCMANVTRNGLDYRALGEDLFAQMCLDHIEVARRFDPGLLSDAFCSSAPDSDCASGAVAMHPMKTVAQQQDCVHQATRATPAQLPIWVVA